MQDKTILIIPPEKTVSIAGESYVLDDFDWPQGVHNLTWDPRDTRLKGFISRVGDSYRFESFDQFERYVAAWQDAKVKADAEKEVAAKAAEAAEAARKAEEEKAIAEAQAKLAAEQQAAMAQFAPYNTLSSTDFKIIKAMEAKLIAEGALDPELVAQREAARQTIRDSKE